jgi:dihydrofolate reductase
MRKLIMWNLVTLDGFFEGPNKWDLDHHNVVWGDELEQLSIDQLTFAGALVFGRVTYEGMASYWRSETGRVADLMNGIPKLVFSRTLEEAEWTNSTLVKGEAVDAVRSLKEADGGDMFVFGSADLSASLTEVGLFDEYRLCVVPALLGAGNPLFKTSTQPHRMTLLGARPLQSGGVILSYRPDGEA